MTMWWMAATTCAGSSASTPLEEQDRRAGGRLPAEPGLLLAVDKGEFEVLRIVSHAVREMSEGELLQLEKSRGLNFSEEVYFDIIRRRRPA
jgi:hypothetical protein